MTNCRGSIVFIGTHISSDISWLRLTFRLTGMYRIAAVELHSRLAASWLFDPRRRALTLLERCKQQLRGLTFELSGRQRQDARPGLVKMYGVPPARAWWPAVGAPLERGVRRHWWPAV